MSRQTGTGGRLISPTDRHLDACEGAAPPIDRYPQSVRYLGAMLVFVGFVALIAVRLITWLFDRRYIDAYTRRYGPPSGGDRRESSGIYHEPVTDPKIESLRRGLRRWWWLNLGLGGLLFGGLVLIAADA
jgi:hypothetical protein